MKAIPQKFKCSTNGVKTFTPIIFLYETMFKKKLAENLKYKLGFKTSFVVDSGRSNGNSRGLAILWDEDIDLRIITSLQNHNCGDIWEDDSRAWRFVGLHGWPKRQNKRKTWALIQDLMVDSSIPIVFGGDFNEILSNDEKVGGV